MSNSAKPPKLHPGNAVIASLYSTVVDNKNMPELFSAWDQFVEHVFQNDPEEAKLWQSLLSEHFEQASPLIVVSKPSLAEEKQDFVDRQTFPAIIFNSRFRLVARNQQAYTLWPTELDSDISSSVIPPFDPQRLLSLKDSVDHPEPLLLSLDIGDSKNPNVVMAVVHSVEFTTGDGASSEILYILRIAKPSWNPDLDRMLSSTYLLTDTEIEVTRALYENQSVSTIAEDRNRSVRTVRTQLSHIFGKTAVSSQTELIGMIANLGQILDQVNKNNPDVVLAKRASSSNSDIQIFTCQSAEGHVLSYASFGDENGKPVLSIQPTTPPEMTKRFRQAMLDAELRFIAPYKPGSGQSSSRSYTYTPDIAAQDFNAILNAEKIDQADILGLYSGGIHALQFANSFPHRVRSLTLIDTGVPLKPPRAFLEMSATARRTFLPARYFPKILLTPHKMVAKDFHESKVGQKRVVEYFFSGSSSDLERVRKNKEYYNITRDIIRYSFEDIRQLVDNVCLWASDWEPLLQSVLAQHEVHFLHGENNDVFMWRAIEKFVAGNPKASATPIKKNAQLGLFVDPELLTHRLS